MIKKIKKFFASVLKNIFFEEIDKKLLLEGKKISLLNKKIKKIKNLSDVEFKVYSQWGEDGIIDWITNKFPNLPKSFLEIGTENYLEANTRFLLINKNWDGYLVEADKEAVKKIKSQKIYWKYNLKVVNDFVTKDNINNVIKKLGVPKKLGLLSVDIDGIDYWVLKQLSIVDPAIIVCEYNSLYGLKESITVPYKKNFTRSKEHYSNLYFGASIQAFKSLLNQKNYILLGTNSAGNNAFFIKKTFSNQVKKIINERKIFKSKFRESRNRKGNLTYLDKKQSLKLIENEFFIDLKNNKKKKLINMKIN